MANKKNNIQNILLLAGVGLAAYFLFKRFTTPAITSSQQTIPVEPSPSSSTTTQLPAPATGCNNKVTFDYSNGRYFVDRDFPLRKLRAGETPSNTDKHTTAYLQAWLNQKYNTCLVVDGIFGGGTESALLSKTGKESGTLNEFNAIYQFGQGGALG